MKTKFSRNYYYDNLITFNIEMKRKYTRATRRRIKPKITHSHAANTHGDANTFAIRLSFTYEK